jgi:cbb3-type cytochrome oxidase subunit 1
VRGVTQAVIDWWFTNNLLFVWFGLAGLGIAFYLITKIAQRPVQATYFALFGFWTFILFAPWCGIPQGAPVPAWLTSASTVASWLTLIPWISFIVVLFKTACGANVECKGGPFCYAKFAMAIFFLSTLMYLATGCPHFGGLVGMTWYMPAQTYLQIFGFFAIVVCGGIYELLAPVMDFELPFPKFVRFQHWLFMLGILLLVAPQVYAGFEQGMKLQGGAPFTDIIQATLNCLRISTLGLLLLLLGSLMLAANIFGMTIKWKLALVKEVTAAIKAPLETEGAKS